VILVQNIRVGMIGLVAGEAFTIEADELCPPGSTLYLMVDLRLRNLHDGTLLQMRRRTDAVFEMATLTDRELEYLYRVDTGYILFDPATFEEYCVPTWLGGEVLAQMQSHQRLNAGFWLGQPVHFEVL